MRTFVVLTEALESRPEDADRVATLARYLREAGPVAGTRAAEWLVAGAPRGERPARLTPSTLAAAAAALAGRAGMPGWLFDVGREASSEAAEAIALLLPWPEGDDAAARPSLAQWESSWRDAAGRADAVAAGIAALDDPMVRRWAVRAVCGLVKPVVDAWQWHRAWARAFDEDAQALAWRWHRPHDTARDVPAPLAMAPLTDAPDEAHATLLAGWHAGEWWAEPRWSGLRVQVVRRGAALAVWQRGGALLNGALPAALVDGAQWPDPCAIEAVLVARLGGRAVAVASVLAERAAAPAKTARRRPPVDEPALHLVLTDWHRWAGDDAHALTAAERRARLHDRWPAPDVGRLDAALPPVFATPHLPPPGTPVSDLRRLAGAGRAAGWSGLVLRRPEVRGHVQDEASPAAWAVRATTHRVRAVLQYVPREALGASAAAASALAFVDCGFALWNRAPSSPEERQAAMTAALAGEFLPPPASDPTLPGLRLLPLARLPIALPDDELQAVHAWLRANAGARFGGVHAVAPALVFEIGFVQVRESRRHRLGAVIDGARVLGWWREAAPGDAHLAADLHATREA